MRNAAGYVTIVDPSGDRPTRELDTLQCGHCGAHVPVQPGQDPSSLGGFCRQCMRHTCQKATCNTRCVPLERAIEQMEARGRFLAQVGLP